MSEKIRTVRLYGELGTKFGRQFNLAVATPAEACNALCEMIPGFKRHLVESKERGVGYAVFLGKRNLKQDELLHPAGDVDIRIAPVRIGSKKAGVLNIILGIVLIIVGVMLSPATGGTSLNLAWAGAAMLAGGIIQLLTPMPKGKGGRDAADDTPSTYFTGPLNTQAQGYPVPLLYGELIIGSAVISAGIYTDDASTSSMGSNEGTQSRNGGNISWRYIGSL